MVMEKEFTFEARDLDAAAERIGELRTGLLIEFSSEEDGDLNAGQFYLLALAALDQAKSYLKLASFHQARAVAEGRR